MTPDEEYQRKADALLRMATGTENMRERGRLIDEAMLWHNRALDAHERDPKPANDDKARNGEQA